METKFTNGPWGVTENSAGSIEVVFGGGSPCRGSEYLCIAPLSSRSDDECIHSGATALANASLIAVAPEMYEMLNDVCEEMFEAGGAGNVRIAREIENLLKKARGES